MPERKERPQKCPLCGGDIDPVTGICSVCGIKLLDRPEEEKKEGPWETFLKLPGINEEFARALAEAGFATMNDLARGKVEDIERALDMNSTLAERVLEEAKSQAIFLCSNCGAFLSPEATVCPFCGAIVYSEEGEEEEWGAEEEEKKTEAPLYMCPVCGAFISPDSTSCSHCGAVFEGEEEEWEDADTPEEIDEEPEQSEIEDHFEELERDEAPEEVAAQPYEELKKQREDEERINLELMKKLSEIEEEPDTKTTEMSEEDADLLSSIDTTQEPAHAVALGDNLVVCGNCGAIIPSGELFCPRCGVELIYGEKAEPEKEVGEDEILRFFGVEGADLSKYPRDDQESGALYICSTCGAFYPESAEKCPVCGTPVSEMERKIPEYEEMLAFDMFPQEPGVSICDVCGAFVPLEKDSCPVCGADMEEHRYIPAKIPATEDDYTGAVEKFFGPLKEVMEDEKEKEQGLYICRVCGAFMAEDATECPICGAKYGEEGGEFNTCPLCGARVPVNLTICPICSTHIGAEIAEEGVEELEALEKIVTEEEGPDINEVIGEEVIEKFMKTVESGEDFFADISEKIPESEGEMLVFSEEEEPEEEEHEEGEGIEELDWEDIVSELDRLEAVDGGGEAEPTGEGVESDINEDTVETEQLPTDAEPAPEDFIVYEEEIPEEEWIAEEDIEDAEKYGVKTAPEVIETADEKSVDEPEADSLEDFIVYEEEAEINEEEWDLEERGSAEDEHEDKLSDETIEGLETSGAEELNIEEYYEESEETPFEGSEEPYDEEALEPVELFIPSEPEEPILPEEMDSEPITEEEGSPVEVTEDEEPVAEEEEYEEVGLDEEIHLPAEKELMAGGRQETVAEKSVRMPRPAEERGRVVAKKETRREPAAAKRKRRNARKYMNAREGLLFTSLIPSIVLLFIYDFLPAIPAVEISLSLFFGAITVAGIILMLMPGERAHPSWGHTILMIASGVTASLFLLKWYLPLAEGLYRPADTLITLGAGGLATYAGSRIRGRGYFLAWLIGSVFMTLFAAIHTVSGPWDHLTVNMIGGVGLAYMMGGGVLLVRVKWEELLVQSTLRRGDSSYLERDYDRAVRAYEKVISMSDPENNPDYDIPWYSKGAALISLGRFEEAIECLDKAIEINPMNEVTWNNKGNALSRLGRHEEAIDCYDRALKINPSYEVAWNNKGNAYARVGRLEDALKCYDRAISINEDYREAWINRGYVLVKLGMYDEAVECANRIIPNRTRRTASKA